MSATIHVWRLQTPKLNQSDALDTPLYSTVLRRDGYYLGQRTLFAMVCSNTSATQRMRDPKVVFSVRGRRVKKDYDPQQLDTVPPYGAAEAIQAHIIGDLGIHRVVCRVDYLDEHGIAQSVEAQIKFHSTKALRLENRVVKLDNGSGWIVSSSVVNTSKSTLTLRSVSFQPSRGYEASTYSNEATLLEQGDSSTVAASVLPVLERSLNRSELGQFNVSWTVDGDEGSFLSIPLKAAVEHTKQPIGIRVLNVERDVELYKPFPVQIAVSNTSREHLDIRLEMGTSPSSAIVPNGPASFTLSIAPGSYATLDAQLLALDSGMQSMDPITVHSSKPVLHLSPGIEVCVRRGPSD